MKKMITTEQAKKARGIGTILTVGEMTDITIPNEYVEVEVKTDTYNVILTMNIDCEYLESGNYNYLLDLENHPFFVNEKEVSAEDDVPSVLTANYGFGEDKPLRIYINLYNLHNGYKLEFYKKWFCKAAWDYTVQMMVEHKEHDDTQSNAPIYKFYNEITDSANTSTNASIVAYFPEVATVVSLRLDWPIVDMNNGY